MAVLIFIQNCSVSERVSFSLDANKVSLASTVESQAGNGEGFLGKPIGDYERTFPNYSCITSTSSDYTSIGHQGFLKANTDAVITSDNCELKNYIFQFTDSVIEFSGYNLDYLGVGTATYERVGSHANGELPAVEAWCQFKSDVKGLDIVIKSSHTLSNSQAKIYTGTRSNSASTWLPRFVLPFGVTRLETSTSLIFKSESLSLEIIKSSSSNLLSSGMAVVSIDGQRINQQLNCRVANLAPIEDMGTALTQLSAVNVFTTDNQEGICSHPAAIFCDNFEGRNAILNPLNLVPNYKNGGWALSSPNNASVIDIGNSFDGTNAMEYIWGANQTGAGTAGFSVPNLRDVYVRYYIKFSQNFVLSSVSTSIMQVFGSSNGIIMYLDPLGVPRLSLSDSSGVVADISANSPLVNRDQWNCLEAHFTISSAPAKSTIELWVNSQKIISRTDLDMSGTFNDIGHWTNWACSGSNSINPSFCDDSSNPSNQHPIQSAAFDNYIVSSQRIGCY